MPSLLTVPMSRMLNGVGDNLIIEFSGIEASYRYGNGRVLTDSSVFDMYKAVKSVCYHAAAAWDVQPKGGYIPLPWKQVAIAKRAWSYIKPFRASYLATLPEDELAMLRRIYGTCGCIPHVTMSHWQYVKSAPVFEEALTSRAALYSMLAMSQRIVFNVDPSLDLPGFDGGDWSLAYCHGDKMTTEVWHSIDAMPGRMSTDWVHNMATWHLPRAIYTRPEWAFMAAASDHLVQHWQDGISDKLPAWHVLACSTPDDFKQAVGLMPETPIMWNRRSKTHLYNFFSWITQRPLTGTSIVDATHARIAYEEEQREKMMRREQEYLERRRQRLGQPLAQEASEGRQAGVVRAEQLYVESFYGEPRDPFAGGWSTRNVGVVLDATSGL